MKKSHQQTSQLITFQQVFITPEQQKQLKGGEDIIIEEAIMN